MRILLVFSLFIFFLGCSENSRDSSDKDSSIDNNIQDSSSTQFDSTLEYENDSRIQDSSVSDSETDSMDYEDSGIEDSDILDSEIIDAYLSDTENKDAEETEEEVITDEPTRIYVDRCADHYANNKRCPEEKCFSSGGYNYVVGCPGKEHAHRYLCEAANPPKDDYRYMLLCTCACADIE